MSNIIKIIILPLPKIILKLFCFPKNKQEMQCTFDIKFRHIPATTVTAEYQNIKLFIT